MKRVRVVLCLFVLAFSFFLVACGTQTQSGDNPQSETTETDGSPSDDLAPSVPINPDTSPIIPDTPSSEEPDEEVHKHILTHIESKSPTCTEHGNIEYWLCSECNIAFSDENAVDKIENTTLSATGHDYTDTVINPTCTENGYTLHKCNNCDDEYITDEVKELGHDYTDTVIEPTCTEIGYTLHTCNNCGDEYKTDEVQAHGHEYGDASVLIKPTCIKPGTQKKTCKHCGESEETELSPHGHGYIETVIKPTCTETGYTLHKCEKCGDEKITDMVPSLGHDYVDTVTEPTCTEIGYTIHTCNNCEDCYIDSEVSPSGHRYSEKWSSDEQEHWHEVICGCEIEPVKFGHEFNTDGVCECGYSEPWEYRLIFVADGNECTLSGITVNEGVGESSLHVEIPSEYNGIPVTKIADDAFNGDRYIERVYIPSTVQTIGKGAFANSGIAEATFETRTGWKCSKYEDGRSATNVTLGSDSNVAKLLKSTRVPNGYGGYYWFCK